MRKEYLCEFRGQYVDLEWAMEINRKLLAEWKAECKNRDLEEVSKFDGGDDMMRLLLEVQVRSFFCYSHVSIAQTRILHASSPTEKNSLTVCDFNAVLLIKGQDCCWMVMLMYSEL